MTEIRVDVDLVHPPERVWRVLTELHLVMGWLPADNFVVAEDRRFSFRTQLDGLDEQIDGQTVTFDRPNRLVMRWAGPNLHTLLSVTLQPTERGCRMTVAQRGFLGAQGTLRGRALQRTYAELLEGPFVQALDRFAASPPAAPPPPPAPARVDSPSRNAGRAFERTRSNSAPGLTSHTRAAVGPTQTPEMPGFAAAVFNAQAARGADVVSARNAGVVSPRGGGGVSPRGVGVVAAGDAGVVSPPGVGVVPARGVGVVPVQQVVRLSRRSSLGRFAGLSRRSSLGRFVRRCVARLAGSTRADERRGHAVAALAAILLLLAMIAMLVGYTTIKHPAHAPQTGGGADAPLDATAPGAPLPTAGDPGHASSLPVVAAVPPSTVANASPAPVALVATYKTERKRLSGYDASITIANPGDTPVDDWSVTVQLPVLDLRIRNVDGAVYATTGQDVTFTPVDDTRTVTPGTPVHLTFQVDGIGKPVSCTIDGQKCVGLPE